MTKIAIVGGGLAGISAARHAMSHGIDFEIFESSEVFGGRLQSSFVGSSVVDRGFQIVNVNYPELKALLSGSPVASRPVFTTLNFINKDHVGSDISPLNIPSLLSPASGSLLQKLRFLGYFLSKPDTSQSLGIYIHRFEDLYDRVLGPFLSGVFLTDPRNIRGDVAKRILRYFLLGRPHLMDGGVGNLISVLMRGIPHESRHLNTRVVGIIGDAATSQLSLQVEQGEKSETFSNFDYAVIATNGSASEIEGTSTGNSRNWLSSTTVYHESKKLPKRIPKLFVSSSFVNSLVISDANPTYSSPEISLIATTYLGEISEPVWQETKEEKEKEIAALYQCDPKELHLISIQSIPHSLPLFSSEDLADGQLPLIDAVNPRILFAGDAFDEPSQNGALRSGRTAIELIVKLSGAPRQD